MDSGEPSESVTNGQTRHVQPPSSAALRAKQQRPKKGITRIYRLTQKREDSVWWTEVDS